MALPRAALAVVLVRRNVDDRRHVAVVRAVNTQHAALARVSARKAKREVVRLRARVYPEDDFQVAREGLAKATRVLEDVGVQVPAVGVKRLELRAARLDDSGVAVTDVAHVIDALYR